MKLIKIVFIAIFAIFITAGCTRGAIPIHNVDNMVNTPMAKKATETQVFNAIVQAGSSLGWKVTKIKAGLAEARLDIRKHKAVVDIKYDAKTYSITYKSSTNLKYNSSTQTIHPNYNNWIINLDEKIATQVQLIK